MSDKGSSGEYERVAVLAHVSHKNPQPIRWHCHPRTARGWKGTGCSCSTGQSEEVLKILHILLLGVEQGLSELTLVIMDLCWERAPSLAQHLKFVGLASSAYPDKDPAFPPAVSWKLLHTGSFLKYELSKIISVCYLPNAQAMWWCLAWELPSLWLKFNTKVLLWHLSVLETHQDLTWLCLNICAAYLGSENAGCFCWCENGGRGQRLWTLSSPTSNKRGAERKNLGKDSFLSLGNISHLAALVMWISHKGKYLRIV